MEAMRRLLVLTLLAACNGGTMATDDAGIDGATALYCDPPVAEAPVATGDGTPPVGTFPASWQCVSGCDGTVPQVIFQGDSLTITSTIRDADAGTTNTDVRWAIDGEPLYAISLQPAGGCWFRYASNVGCASSFYICDGLGRTFIPHFAVRDPRTGIEQTWKMN